MKKLSDNIKPILALFVVFSCILYIFLTSFMPTQSQDSQGLIAMIGFGSLALGYYLGNSTGSAKKDELIQDLTKKQ